MITNTKNSLLNELEGLKSTYLDTRPKSILTFHNNEGYDFVYSHTDIITPVLDTIVNSGIFHELDSSLQKKLSELLLHKTRLMNLIDKTFTLAYIRPETATYWRKDIEVFVSNADKRLDALVRVVDDLIEYLKK